MYGYDCQRQNASNLKKILDLPEDYLLFEWRELDSETRV